LATDSWKIFLYENSQLNKTLAVFDAMKIKLQNLGGILGKFLVFEIFSKFYIYLFFYEYSPLCVFNLRNLHVFPAFRVCVTLLENLTINETLSKVNYKNDCNKITEVNRKKEDVFYYTKLLRTNKKSFSFIVLTTMDLV
jgi:hypothetical protein